MRPSLSATTDIDEAHYRPLSSYITCYGAGDDGGCTGGPRPDLSRQPAEAAGRANAGGRGARDRGGRIGVAADPHAIADRARSRRDDGRRARRGGRIEPAGGDARYRSAR